MTKRPISGTYTGTVNDETGETHYDLSPHLAPTPGPDPTPDPEPEPAPGGLEQTSGGFREFVAHMLAAGRWHCAPEAPAGTVGVDARRKYYGGDMRGLASLGDITGDPHLHELATANTRDYAEHLTSGGSVAGRWVFPHNLARCAVETGEPIFLEALVNLATRSPFGQHTGDLDRLRAEFRPTRVRDFAYLASTYGLVTQIGATAAKPFPVDPVPVWETCIKLILVQFDAWLGSAPAGYVQPFILALAAEALWEYAEAGPANYLRVACQEAIVAAAEWIEAHAWRPANASWQYWIDLPAEAHTRDINGSPDLNALIAFIPAAAYKLTGVETYAARYDDAITSARQRAYVVNKWQPGAGAKMWAQGVRLLRQAAELRFGVDLGVAQVGETGPAPAAEYVGRRGSGYRTELDYTTNIPCSVADVHFEADGGPVGGRPPLSIRTRRHRIWFPNWDGYTYDLAVTFRDLAGNETTHEQTIKSRP